jgi:hypothetical protein
MHSRLRAKPRRTGWHLGNTEGIKALWAHRLGSGPPSTEWKEQKDSDLQVGFLEESRASASISEGNHVITAN